MSTLIREKISLIQGDIVELKVDVIVNAANDSLLGGDGVDGAIHYAAGPELLAECRTLNGCETGEAKITKGYNLPASSVIHTVGPIWQGGNYQEDQLLASCYFHCLKLATEYQLKTIAFPSISTGSYDFPLERATKIAVLMVKKFLKKKQDTSISQVIFVTFGQKAFQCYQDTINEIFNDMFG